MVKKLKKKFIFLATVSMFVLMTLLVGIMNIVNYSSVVSEIDTILTVLSQPNAPFVNPKEMFVKLTQDINNFIPRGMSPEVPFEARYFTAIVSNNGSIEESDFSRIVSIDSESVDYCIQSAIEGKNDRGFVGQFRYVKQSIGKMTRIVFLDCGRKLDSFRTFMNTSITVGIIGCLIVFLIFILFSGRIIKPIAESYEKQKRFITDAGHEIKTPLTIIGANLDILEYDYGNNESFADIRTQTERLSSLTNDLVYLTKMEEAETGLRKSEFPVSDLISEVAQQFRGLAQSKNKEFNVSVEQNVIMCGSADAVRQLIYILLDNAMKYSEEGGKVSLDMHVRKKSLCIEVSNTITSPIDTENISHLFDRFYRTDVSRNSETGGYGIGLSIAQAIVTAHGGKISADIEDESIFRIHVLLPL